MGDCFGYLSPVLKIRESQSFSVDSVGEMFLDDTTNYSPKILVLYKYLLLDIIKINRILLAMYSDLAMTQEFFKDIDKQDYKFSDCMSSREPFCGDFQVVRHKQTCF